MRLIVREQDSLIMVTQIKELKLKTWEDFLETENLLSHMESVL
jgi:hypothetical protein